MNKITKLGFLLIFLFISNLAFSQIVVKSFESLDTDLDASTFAPKKDLNGKTCAIIKIFTTQVGFSFDNGALGITAVEHKPAEIWVYVPEGTMKLKIVHPQLGHISNAEGDGYFWFPTGRVKSGKVYKIDLVTGQVRTIVEEAKKLTGWLIFNSVPEGADVYLAEEGGEEKYIGITPKSQKMPYGTYNYRVKKYTYSDEVGVINLNQDRITKNIVLKQASGSISVYSTPSGASIYMNGEDTGEKTPFIFDNVPLGKCDIRLQLNEYAPASSVVNVYDGQRANINLTLEARFAKISITSIEGATIKINGNEVAKTSYNENLMEGIYDIEVSLAGHETITKQIEVSANIPQKIDLRPIPIYGSLDVMSNPIGANITINGKSYGDTPKTIDNLLIGEYDVVLTKEGLASTTKHVTITKDTPAVIDVKFETGRIVEISTNKKGDKIYVDGVEVGISPCNVELAFGNHEIVAERDGVTVSKTMAVAKGAGNLEVQLKLDTKKSETKTVADVVKKDNKEENKKAKPEKSKKEEPFFKVGVEGGFMYGKINTYNKTSVGFGVMARIGRTTSLVNANIGLKYQFSSVGNAVYYNFLDYESYNTFQGDADYKNKANELVIPIIANFNIKKFYVGVGYEQGIKLSNKETYTPTGNYDFNLDIYKVSPDYQTQIEPKLPASSLVLQAGFLHRHLDVKLVYKYDLANAKGGGLNIGVGVGYYF